MSGKAPQNVFVAVASDQSMFQKIGLYVGERRVAADSRGAHTHPSVTLPMRLATRLGLVRLHHANRNIRFPAQQIADFVAGHELNLNGLAARVVASLAVAAAEHTRQAGWQ